MVAALAGCSDPSMVPAHSGAGGNAGADQGSAGAAGRAGNAAQAGAGGRDTQEGRAGAVAMAGRSAGGAGGTVSPPVMQPPDLDPQAGNTGFVQPSCGAPVAPVTGRLCGPSAAPCRRIAEHTFDLLTAEAEVSLAFADGHVHILQERATPTVLVPATDTFREHTDQIQGPTMKGNGSPLVNLAFDDAGAAVALLYGGRPGTTELWRRGANGWAFDSRTQADLVERKRLHAGEGCLHAALLLNNDVSPDGRLHPVYAVYDGRWQEFVLGPRNIEYAGVPALALDAVGMPHLAYWRATARGYTLYYAVPGETLEPVGATGSASPPGVQHIPRSPLLAVTADPPPDGEAVVHVARAFFEPNSNAHAIALATRRGGAWTEREVLRWAPRSIAICPMVEGQECTYTVENIELRGLFASASGDLRLVVERHTHTQTDTYRCMILPIDCINPPPCGPNPRTCSFNPGLPMDAKDETLIGWPEGDAFEFAPYDGPVPDAVSPDGHFWARRRGSATEPLTLIEHGP